jgi:hypothetical protein
VSRPVKVEHQAVRAICNAQTRLVEALENLTAFENDLTVESEALVFKAMQELVVARSALQELIRVRSGRRIIAASAG